MVDIHSHILPYVDDGANSLETSFEMLEIAKYASTDSIVLTPHTNLYDHDKNLYDDIKYVFDAFKEKLAQNDIDINVYLGGEAFANENLIDLAQAKKLPTINGSRFLLVEFDFYASSSYILDTLKKLSYLGYVPIVAHPERYECVKKRYRLALDFMNNGALLQINKGSFVGDFGVGARDTAFELVNHRLAQFVASDSHNTTSRNPDMETVFDIIREEYDDKIARKLFEINPQNVIENKKLVISRPIV